MRVGSVSGVLEAVVVAEPVPPLLPISLLEDLGCIIDLQRNVVQVQLGPEKVELGMQKLPSGHRSIE
eukprot:1550557-Lingulodinium_polyedra.AAC.1